MWIAGDPVIDIPPINLAMYAAGFAALAVVARPVWRFVRSLRQFLDDWHGAPERLAEGVPERPGVLKRLAHVEHLLNGGGLAAKIDQHLEEAAEHYAELTSKIDTLADDVRDARELAVDTAVTAASAIREIDEKVTQELRESRAEAEGLRASLYESLQVDNLGDD